MHFCQYWESLAANWSHGYYTVGRLNGGMALKFETERKVNCPHKYLLSITKQTILRSPSPSVSGAHSAQSHMKWPFPETSVIVDLQREKEALQNHTFYLVSLQFCCSLSPYVNISEIMFAKKILHDPFYINYTF